MACEWGRSTAAQLTLHDSVDVRFQACSDTEHEIGENQVKPKRAEQPRQGGVAWWCGVAWCTVMYGHVIFVVLLYHHATWYAVSCRVVLTLVCAV